MKKIVLRLWITFISVSLFACNSENSEKGSETKESEKPNIIYILTDDLGYGDVGVFFQNERKRLNDRSEPWMATPNLDKMAAEGAMFTNHYTAAPVCAPSRSSLLSGLNQGHANVRNNQFDKALADNHTLGNVMQKAGYVTSAIGKWGLQGDTRYSEMGDQWPAKPTNRGFDYFYGYMRHVDGHEHYPEEGIYRGKRSVWENETKIDTGLDKSYTTDLWTAFAKKWIVKTNKDSKKPFFMFLAYDTPHAVLEVPTQKYPDGGGLNGGLQWIGQSGKMINTSTGVPDSFIHEDYANATYDHDKDASTAEIPWPDTYKRYATMVRRIDNAVGDIIQLLKDLEIDDNTLIVFTSDNGPSEESYLPDAFVKNTPDFFNSFGQFNGIKRDVLEGGERMPLIARWPSQIKPNTVVEEPNIAYDWLPTFTEAAGLVAPANGDGVSLLPSLTGTGKQKPSQIYSEYAVGGKTPAFKDFAENNRGRIRRQMQMIRNGNLVGIRYDIQSGEDDFEIYDILKDPQQANNLAETDTLKALQLWMKEEVIRLRRPADHAKRPYDEVPMTSVDVNPSSIGVNWKSYSGSYPWLPKMDDLEPDNSGAVASISEIKKDGNYYLLEAYMKIPETGSYTFKFSSGSKALVRIHNATLFDADYNFKSGQELTSTIILEKGFHPVRIYYQKNQSGMPFQMTFTSSADANSEDRKPDFYVQ